MSTDDKFRFSGNFLFIGFGSITKAVLPLLLASREIDAKYITVLSPAVDEKGWFEKKGVRFIKAALTKENYASCLNDLLEPGDFLVNLSVGVSSIDLMKHAAQVGALYLDTCIEPWDGGYDDPSLSVPEQTNYALRHQALELRKNMPEGPTAVIAHGANPGLISHLLKDALMRLAKEFKRPLPMTKEGLNWAVLAMQMGVKVIHVAERDTQRSARIKQDDEFVNTWSVDGFLSEGRQPAELVWGTHEKTWLNDARLHTFGSKNAIYLERSGASVRVKTWTPAGGPCLGLLITHHETISTADLLTVKKNGEVIYRPTMHYAYHPCDDALLSIDELIGNGWKPQTKRRVMCEEIAPSGVDALGVLLMGHEKNAYWYGSVLSVDQARKMAPFNTATSLQVAAGVFSGITWAIRHPDQGIVEPEQMDHEEVLRLASPYLGDLVGIQTDWRPTGRNLHGAQQNDASPWQFEQFIV